MERIAAGLGSTEAQCGNCAKLLAELAEWKSKCADLERENERQKKELKTLESEIEEMHDNFKEEESEQFEQLKQELDVATKNCKILQIKLNKSERQYGQLEQVKTMLEQQLIEQHSLTSPSDKQDDRLQRQTSQDEPPGAQSSFEMSPDHEHVKIPTREYDQLLRDLNDTSERERDLQEQVKYSQEEAQLKGERLQAVEGENEVLMSRLSKLTTANSTLRSSLLSGGSQLERQSQASAGDKQHLRDWIEQNEQLKLALELAQSEGARLRTRNNELQALASELKESLRSAEETQRLEQQQQLRLDSESPTDGGPNSEGQRQQQLKSPTNERRAVQALELECRQLRARLVHYEREQRQMRSQLESIGQRAGSVRPSAGANRSRSVEEADQCRASSKCQAQLRQLAQQCEQATRRARELEQRLAAGGATGAEALPASSSGSHLECDLLDKLKRQLDNSESELAKARSRLVELDIECSKAQRQYKRLLNSFDSCGSEAELQLVAARRLKLPSEPMREAMSRADLRQALRELESDLDELVAVVRAKDCLIREKEKELARWQQDSQLQARSQEQQQRQERPLGVDSAAGSIEEQQVKSLRRILDQERLLSNNLKLDVANLEQECNELRTRGQMLERERGAMDEELDKLRKLCGELRDELEESQQQRLKAQTRTRELNETVEKLRFELAEVQRSGALRKSTDVVQSSKANASGAANTELLVLTRDLSELKVKNGFLMRQLEMARDDARRQLDELGQAHEQQQRRAVELAQLEVRETSLAVEQQLKDELNDFRQKVASLQRQTARHDEELATERERARALERDWRRDKSQWQQTREQLEGQLSIEKRSFEFKLKEAEAAQRDRERAYLSLQDKCVQLERDFKRVQNKYQLLEEDCESRIKSLTRELEFKSKDVLELSAKLRVAESQTQSHLKKLSDDNKMLGETLDSLRRSYESKLQEAKQLREHLIARQEQSYRERQQSAEQVAELARRLSEAQEGETQAKLLKQRLETQERQLDSSRRDLAQTRDERARLRTRCEELEKRELIAKTSTISSTSFLRPFVGQSRGPAARGELPSKSDVPAGGNSSAQLEQQQTIDRLSGKINDQRNLIQMLRQQLSEIQLELKQMKLLQTSERSRWQTRVAILTSRLNESEEKLAFEMTTSLSSLDFHQEQQQLRLPHPSTDPAQSSSLFGHSLRPKLEAQFEAERRANLELIQQQQAQIDALARESKKISQAHDLLRLQCKQLESNNNKLSKKLIEYQQQQPMAYLAQQKLEARLERLTQANAQLRAETRPIVEIVTKIVASLDAPEQQVARQQLQTAPITHRGLDSTNRPLRAPGPASLRRLSDENSFAPSPSRPVAPVARASPITRLFGAGQSLTGSTSAQQRAGRPTTESPDYDDKNNAGDLDEDEPQSVAFGRRKPLKRVRVKCSSLGITTNEKRQLKQRLKTLAEALSDQPAVEGRLEGVGSKLAPADRASPQLHSLHSGAITPASGNSPSAVRWQRPVTSSSAQTNSTGQQRRVDSEQEEFERSWSQEPSPSQRVSSLHRRFTQASPRTASTGASLTDYESESSIASDYVVSNRFGSFGGGGAESDSGISPSGGGSGRSMGKSKKIGLKGRVANTLRTISRSISQGLASAPASDTEHESRDTSEIGLREIRV